MSSNEAAVSGKNYVGYDYKTITVDGEKASMYTDAYENFGWIPDESAPAKQFAGVVTLKLKRDRKILNKTELTRLQQHFEACMDEIAAHENSKTIRATIYSIIIGLVGTAFLAGSVFAVTAEPPMILLCVLLGVPGLIGWAAAYPLYNFFINKRAAEVMPLIEKKYDEVHEICEKGSALVF